MEGRRRLFSMQKFLAISVCTALLAGVIVGASSAQFVPVVFWSNERSGVLEKFPMVSAGQRISSQNFLDDFASQLGSVNNLVVFVQDKLSVEDFTQYGNAYASKKEGGSGGAFRNLMAILNGENSAIVPATEDAAEILTQPLGKDWSVVTIPPSDISSFKFIDGRKNLIIINLPDLGSDARKSFQLSDEYIGQTMDMLKKEKQEFVAAFTGASPSRMEHIVLVHDRIGRSLLQIADGTDNGTVTWTVGDCLVIKAQSVKLKIQCPKAATITLPSDGGVVDKDQSTCTNKSSEVKSVATSTLSVTYKNIPDSTDGELNLKMTFEQSGAQWKTKDFIISVKGTFNGTTMNGNASASNQDAWSAPKGFYYHCDVDSQHSAVVQNQTEATCEKKGTVAVQFMDVKIQPFLKASDSNTSTADMGKQSDCVAFFTPPILMGLIVSLILTVILAYGLAMIMNLKTMDRFDDPKGKSITVPQTAD